MGCFSSILLDIVCTIAWIKSTSLMTIPSKIGFILNAISGIFFLAGVPIVVRTLRIQNTDALNTSLNTLFVFTAGHICFSVAAGLFLMIALIRDQELFSVQSKVIIVVVVAFTLITEIVGALCLMKHSERKSPRPRQMSISLPIPLRPPISELPPVRETWTRIAL
ncbi:hypothetical protein B0H14DRAFT_2714312 [Mycena olivaceomarginata]|nr:hypothetical protein B0H14DRAFT_2714312 [Mycena olivaceomarginata]